VCLEAVLSAGCSLLPGQQERARAEESLRTIDTVAEVHFMCGGSLLANEGLCADVVMKDGARLRFEHVGSHAFGTNAVNVFVAAADRLVPRVATCAGIGAPNFQRNSALGHHFNPVLIDVKDAAFRYREVLEEVEFWPQCPQYWEVQDRQGTNYRYCARTSASTDEPSRPQNCP
jgi:hypothetical protein